jgi:hypothetical protein
LVAGVPIITSLAGINDTVSANLNPAGPIAAISGFIIRVVAGFIAALVRLKIRAQNAVAAASRYTIRRAAVGIKSVAVIAVFTVVDTTITAALHHAVVVTRIRGVRISIITFFARIHTAVTAKGGRYHRITPATCCN